jgi:hypothetical protein
MAEAIVIRMKGATATKKEKKKKFASHEKVKIRFLQLVASTKANGIKFPRFMTR